MLAPTLVANTTCATAIAALSAFSALVRRAIEPAVLAVVHPLLLQLEGVILASIHRRLQAASISDAVSSDVSDIARAVLDAVLQVLAPLPSTPAATPTIALTPTSTLTSTQSPTATGNG